MFAHNRMLSTLLIAAAIGVGAHSAWANSVASIDTGVANWQYVSTTSVDPSTTGVAAPILIAPNPNWLSADFVDSFAGESSPGAVWIGSNPNGGSTGYYGNSVFSLTISYAQFNPPLTGSPRNFEVSGVISADNEVIDLYLLDSSGLIPLSLTPIPLYDGTPGQSLAYGFQRVIGGGGTGLLHDPVALFAVVHNDYPPSAGADPYTHLNQSPEDPHNPMGLIVAGSIRAVPLPTSVGVGFAMLGGFGTLAGLRKKLRRRRRIV